MYHLQNKETERHVYYNALTAIMEDVKDLGVSKSKLDKHEWDEAIETEKYIIRSGILIGVAEVRLNNFFIAAHDHNLKPILVSGGIEVNGKKITYKKSYLIDGEKYKDITEVLFYFLD